MGMVGSTAGYGYRSLGYAVVILGSTSITVKPYLDVQLGQRRPKRNIKILRRYCPHGVP